MVDELLLDMKALVDSWDSIAANLRQTHQRQDQTYAVGYTYGSADAFESAAKILQSMMTDELGEMSLHWDSLADGYSENALTHDDGSYNMGYSIGKSDVYREAASKLRSLITANKERTRDTSPSELTNFLHFACTWLIDLAGMKDLRQLIYITIALDCQLRFGQYGISDQGFQTMNLVVSTPSPAVFERFLEEATRRTRFKDWIRISKESFVEISHMNSILIPSLQEIGNRGDGLTQAAVHNSEILKSRNQSHSQ